MRVRPTAHLLGHVAPMMVLSVVAWFGFLVLFRAAWPSPDLPSEGLAVFAGWLAAGTLGFVAAMVAIWRWLRTPAAWRASAGIALTAPALCLDAIATLAFDAWFPGATAADARAYPALILGAVGLLLLTALAATRTTAEGGPRGRSSAGGEAR